MWILLLFVFLFFLLAKIKKPATTLPQSYQAQFNVCITCAPPSGDTFPSNLPTIAWGSPEPVQPPVSRVFVGKTGSLPNRFAFPVRPLVYAPVDAPPPFNLNALPRPVAPVRLYGNPYRQI